MTRGRVLLTGFTTQHVGRNNRFDYDVPTRMVKLALETAGFDVDNRIVHPEETLEGYDAVMIGIGPLNGLSARYSLGALDAMTTAQERDVPLLLLLDDWQVHLVKTSAQSSVVAPSRLVRPVMRTARVGEHFDWAVDNLDRLVPAAETLRAGPWPTTVGLLLDGGDQTLLNGRVLADKLVAFNPSPFVTNYPVKRASTETRDRRWVFGVLSNQTKWLEKLAPSWPVAHRGGKASKSPEGGVKEHELLQMYADSWGVLSCPYWHCGSGWARFRHEHAAHTGSILLTKPGELTFIDPSYDQDVHALESLSSRELQDVAEAQRQAWYAQRPTREQVADRLATAIDLEIERLR